MGLDRRTARARTRCRRPHSRCGRPSRSPPRSTPKTSSRTCCPRGRSHSRRHSRPPSTRSSARPPRSSSRATPSSRSGWSRTVTRTRTSSSVLQGKHALSIKDGKVQLNLLPRDRRGAPEGQQQHQRALREPDRVDHELSPDEARAKLSSALGRPLPADFGTITVFEKQQLSTRPEGRAVVQRGRVRLGDRRDSCSSAPRSSMAPDRRRIAIWVGLSAAGFLIAFRAVARISGRHVVNQIVVPVNRDATQAVMSRVLASYLDVTLISLLDRSRGRDHRLPRRAERYSVATREWVGSSSVAARARRRNSDRRVGARAAVHTPRVAHVREAVPRRADRRALEFALWRIRATKPAPV